MSAPDPVDLELARLARLLRVDADELADLAPAGAADLKVLRAQVAARLHDEGQDSFRRAAQVSGMVPAKLAATLAEHGLGPVLSARTTAVLDPAKAAELAERFSPAFLADVAEELDPRVVADLVATMPAQIIADVAQELAARQEWLVMADFVGAISSEALQRTVAVLSDEAVLRTSALLEDRERLEEVVAGLDDDRLASLADTARELQADELVEGLRASLSPEQRARIPAP